jgi:hypothetical protein
MDPLYRPKGMHRETFRRLEARFVQAADRAESLALAALRVCSSD